MKCLLLLAAVNKGLGHLHAVEKNYQDVLKINPNVSVSNLKVSAAIQCTRCREKLPGCTKDQPERKCFKVESKCCYIQCTFSITSC